ncbi:hypothetical protein HYT00_00100 [Candidatus Giovannonibacteria bacterium]|nr:hypothetical protein [Candidatus Giovannonibacteria bacterium]
MIQNRGFTLLLSLLIVSIILAVSLGVSDIISGEIFLANTGRQSQAAFYAADAGVECAIYWDTVHDGYSQSLFATSTASSNTENNACASKNISNVGGWQSCSPACTGPDDKKEGVSSFTITFDNGSCANISVTKRENYSLAVPVIETFIRSDGHDRGDANCNVSGRVFQRSLTATIYE